MAVRVSNQNHLMVHLLRRQRFNWQEAQTAIVGPSDGASCPCGSICPTARPRQAWSLTLFQKQWNKLCPHTKRRSAGGQKGIRSRLQKHGSRRLLKHGVKWRSSPSTAQESTWPARDVLGSWEVLGLPQTSFKATKKLDSWNEQANKQKSSETNHSRWQKPLCHTALAPLLGGSALSYRRGQAAWSMGLFYH